MKTDQQLDIARENLNRALKIFNDIAGNCGHQTLGLLPRVRFKPLPKLKNQPSAD
jgi:hypothetical protein